MWTAQISEHEIIFNFSTWQFLGVGGMVRGGGVGGLPVDVALAADFGGVLGPKLFHTTHKKYCKGIAKTKTINCPYAT